MTLKVAKAWVAALETIPGVEARILARKGEHRIDVKREGRDSFDWIPVKGIEIWSATETGDYAGSLIEHDLIEDATGGWELVSPASQRGGEARG